jgi:hypothetical protein
MCSSCGKKSRGLPGATSQNAIVLGDANGEPAQPATFLTAHPNAAVGDYKYVTGTGVTAAVDAGDIRLGYQQYPTSTTAPAPTLSPTPEWYVQTGVKRWIGFRTRAAAERYARTISGTVITREEVLQMGE